MDDNYQSFPQNQDVPPALALHKFQISFFKDHLALEIRREVVSLPQLAELIQNTRGAKKKRLPWLKLAVFGENLSPRKSYRHNANVIEVSGVEVEHDAGTMSFSTAIKIMRHHEIRCLVYTSPSFIAGEKEKWRILAPALEPVSPQGRVQLVERINGLLGGVATRESFVLSQAFYYGAVDGNAHHQAVVVDGDPIDWCTDLDEGAIGKPPLPRAARVFEIADAGQAISRSDAEITAVLQASGKPGPDGKPQWHNLMLSATASMIGKGWSDERIFEVCKPYCPLGLNEDDFKKIIRGGREKYRPVDPGIDWSTKLAGPLKAIAANAGVVLPIVTPQWRERYATSFPKASFHNARLAIQTLKIHCSRDTFHNRDWMGRDEAASPSEPLLPFLGRITDNSMGDLRVYLSEIFGLDFTEQHLNDAVNTLCNQDKFDPVVDMLNEAERNWDGVPRLDQMAVDFFNAEDTPFHRQAVRKTMIGAVARARQPGCKFDTILTLESEEGWNKSSAWAVLAGEDNFSDTSILGHHGREVQEQLASCWIHENAELAGMKKADAEAIKAFASRQVDRARPAYGRRLVEQLRHSIEVGTTNSVKYLQSPTGNRRFWPIQVTRPIDLKKLRAARLQLWGEAAHYQAAGEALALDEELWAAARIEQESRRVEHPWEVLIDSMSYVPKSGVMAGAGAQGIMVIHSDGIDDRVHTADIYRHVVTVNSGTMHRGHTLTIQEIMVRKGWKHKPNMKIEGRQGAGYVRLTPTKVP